MKSVHSKTCSTRKVIASRWSSRETGLILMLDCGCKKRARFDRIPDRTTCQKCGPKYSRTPYPWRLMKVGETFELLKKSARTMVCHATELYSPKQFRLNGTTVTRVK
jgi:hypothetical protein